MSEHIYPIYDELVSRRERQEMLGQRSAVFWLTGLSGSGKSTLAVALERTLFKSGHLAQVLDGDNIRDGISKNLTFSEEDRRENIRRISEVAKLYVNTGVVTIASFISPTKEIRTFARSIVGPEDFYEIFVDAPLEVCEERDVKGLYARARAGEIKNFTGIDAPYEAPETPDLRLDTDTDPMDTCLSQLYRFVKERITIEE